MKTPVIWKGLPSFTDFYFLFQKMFGKLNFKNWKGIAIEFENMVKMLQTLENHTQFERDVISKAPK